MCKELDELNRDLLNPKNDKENTQVKHFKITLGIRDGDNEYFETWEMDNPCSGFFGELLPDSDPDKLTDMDNKFLLNHFFGEGLCLGEDDEGNESLEATEDECGRYWLGSGERLVWIEGIEEILPIEEIPQQWIKVHEASQDHIDLYKDFSSVLYDLGIGVERDAEAEEIQGCDMVILISKKEDNQ